MGASAVATRRTPAPAPGLCGAIPICVAHQAGVIQVFDNFDKQAVDRAEAWPRVVNRVTRAHRRRLGSGLIDPEDDCCGDASCREEGMSESIVSGSDASPVLELCEQVLDPVALPVDGLVAGEGSLAAAALRGCTARCPCRRGPGGTRRCHSRDQRSGARRPAFVEHHASADMVANLSAGEPEGDRTPGLIARSVQLGVQSAFGASDMAVNIPS